MITIDSLMTLLQNQINSLLKQKAIATEAGDIVAIEDFDGKIAGVQEIITKLQA
jgi:hypothetical protein